MGKLARPEITLWLVRVLRFAIGGLFVYAGALKAQDPALFALAIHNYRLLPWPACAAVALYLPYLEIISGLCVVANKLAAGALRLLSILTFIFIAAVLSAWIRGLDISCGCFGGTHPDHSLAMTLFGDVLLLAGILLLLARRPPKAG